MKKNISKKAVEAATGNTKHSRLNTIGEPRPTKLTGPPLETPNGLEARGMKMPLRC